MGLPTLFFCDKIAEVCNGKNCITEITEKITLQKENDNETWKNPGGLQSFHLCFLSWVCDPGGGQQFRAASIFDLPEHLQHFPG